MLGSYRYRAATKYRNCVLTANLEKFYNLASDSHAWDNYWAQLHVHSVNCQVQDQSQVSISVTSLHLHVYSITGLQSFYPL